MKKAIIEELGTVELDNVEVINGQIEIHMPLANVGTASDLIIDKCLQDFKNNHPDVSSKEVCFDFRLVFSFGFDNPEFTVEVIAWKESDEEVVEFYEEIPIKPSSNATRKIKRIIWDKLGEELFNL